VFLNGIVITVWCSVFLNGIEIITCGQAAIYYSNLWTILVFVFKSQEIGNFAFTTYCIFCIIVLFYFIVCMYH